MNLDRFEGCLIGLALGDALGAPYEFHHPPFYVPDGFRPGYFGTAPGEGTDDTALAGILADTLISNGGDLDLDVWVRALGEWVDSGPPDIGAQTSRAIHDLRHGRLPRQHGRAGGNGALMAIAPAALRMAGSPQMAQEFCRGIAAYTHPHPDSLNACEAFGRAIAGLVSSGSWPSHLPVPYSLPADPTGPRQGWARLTLAIASRALLEASMTGSPMFVLRAVISLGGDTDTNAAVSGALLGAAYGTAAWPPILVDRLHEAPAMRRRAEALFEIATHRKSALPT